MGKSNSITVLGGGISGITTAILLLLAGYRVKIIAELLPLEQEYEKANPRFQSVIAAASVIPHNIDADDIQTILNNSQSFFHCFLEEKVVRLQHHYEIFEAQKELPDYKDAVENFQVLTDEYRQSHKVPKRNGVNKVYGWHFDAYFVEMPKYLKRLYEIFSDLGGSIQRGTITRDDIANMPDGLLVNCMGSWSSNLFDNPYPSKYIRGHLIQIAGLEIPTDEKGVIYSYNYTPNKDTYNNKSGVSNDVYFYPRSDAWIIGGSRQVGELNEAGEWSGDDSLQPSVDINGIQVPQPILDLNKDILANLTGVDITKHPLRAVVGYRYATTPLRIESTQENGRPVIHNYGHGGAGVTTSWGCSLRVLKIAQRLNLIEPLHEEPGMTQMEITDRLKQTLLRHLS
jgi:D-amino-acid oxidase